MELNLTETCEWFTGGFSIVCHTETTGFMGDVTTLTVLTYDAEDKIYSFYELNSMGVATQRKAPSTVIPGRSTASRRWATH